MFVWLERAEKFVDQPEHFIVGFQGRFDEDTRAVSLWLQMFGGPERGDVEISIWEKTVGDSMVMEDIKGEEIYNKFRGKIAKVIDELPKDFIGLVGLFQKKLTDQAGHPVYFDPQEESWFSSSLDLPED